MDVETYAQFQALVTSLTQFSEESAAVSELEEKHLNLITSLSALNQCFPHKSIKFFLSIYIPRFISNMAM